MKKVLIIFFLCVSVITSGYLTPKEKKFKAGIIFNSEPFTRETAGNYSKRFERGQRIYWLFMSKKDIKAQYIKVQVISATHKTGFATISGIAYTHDYKIDKDSPHYFTDYFVIHSAGHYYMQIFDRNMLFKPITIADFYVK